MRSSSSLVHLFENADLPGKPVVSYDRFSAELVDFYPQVQIEEHDAQAEIIKYRKRKESFSESIVVTKRIQNQRVRKMKEYEIIEVDVVTQFVPWRLHLIQKKLSFDEVIFLLFYAAKGFRELFHRAKLPFLISASMIGISELGFVRVWWNENFSKNSRSFLHTNISVGDMVKSIVTTILSYGEVGDKKLMSFQEKLNRIQNINFVNCEFMIKKEIEFIYLPIQTIGKKLVKQDPGFLKAIQTQKTQIIKFQFEEQQVKQHKIIQDRETKQKQIAAKCLITKKNVTEESTSQIIKKHGIKLEQSKTLLQKCKNTEETCQMKKGEELVGDIIQTPIAINPIGLKFKGSLKKVIRFKYMNANIQKQSPVANYERSKSLKEIKSYNPIAGHKRFAIDKSSIYPSKKSIIKSHSQPKIHAHQKYEKQTCLVCQNLLKLREKQRKFQSIPYFIDSPSRIRLVEENIMKKSAPINFFGNMMAESQSRRRLNRARVHGQECLQSSFIKNTESMAKLLKNNPQTAGTSQLSFDHGEHVRKQTFIDRLQQTLLKKNQF